MSLSSRVYFPLLLVISILFVFTACKKEDPDAVAAEDRKKIEKFIKENDLEDVAVRHESGLYYVMENEGTGSHPDMNTVIRMRYEGYLLDDTDVVFDKSDGTFIQLGTTIQGWQIGIPLFKNGGKGMLLIPSALAYGSYPPYGSVIPRHACLVFEFTILDMN